MGSSGGGSKTVRGASKGRKGKAFGNSAGKKGSPRKGKKYSRPSV